MDAQKRAIEQFSRGKLPLTPHLGLEFKLGLGLVLGMGGGTVFLGGNCPKTPYEMTEF